MAWTLPFSWAFGPPCHFQGEGITKWTKVTRRVQPAASTAADYQMTATMVIVVVYCLLCSTTAAPKLYKNACSLSYLHSKGKEKKSSPVSDVSCSMTLRHNAPRPALPCFTSLASSPPTHIYALSHSLFIVLISSFPFGKTYEDGMPPVLLFRVMLSRS